MADEVSLSVCYLTDLSRVYIRTPTDSTVAEFKALVAMHFDVPVDRQRLFHNNVYLRDDQTIESYGLQDGHMLYLIRRSTSSASTSVAAAATPLGENNTHDSSSKVGSVQNQGFGGSNSASLSSGLDGISDGTIPKVLINVQYSSETRFAIPVRLNLTVGEFKGLITELKHIPVDEQRLIYSGQILQDDKTIESYGLQEGHVIHLARRTLPVTSASVADPTPVSENSTDILTGVGSVQSQVFEDEASSLFGHGTFGFEGEQHVWGNPHMTFTFMPNIESSPEGSEGSNMVHAPLLYVLPVPWGGNTATGGFLTNNTLQNRVAGTYLPGFAGLGIPEVSGLDANTSSFTYPATRIQAFLYPATFQIIDEVIHNDPQSGGLVDINPQVLEVSQNPIMSMGQWVSPGSSQVINIYPQSSTLVNISPWVLETPRDPIMSMSPWASQGRSQVIYNAPQNPLMSMSQWASQGRSQQLRASHLSPFGLLARGTGQTARGAAVPPVEIRIAHQLSQLHEMGFTDNLANLRALIDTSGNLTAALALLLRNRFG